MESYVSLRVAEQDWRRLKKRVHFRFISGRPGYLVSHLVGGSGVTETLLSMEMTRSVDLHGQGFFGPSLTTWSLRDIHWACLHEGVYGPEKFPLSIACMLALGCNFWRSRPLVSTFPFPPTDSLFKIYSPCFFCISGKMLQAHTGECIARHLL